jgi:acyl-CoA reductase-like NAD-dependent aldehyde dehydrogenase
VQMFVAGAWVDARSGETFAAFSPGSGEAIGELPKGDRGDAAAAIAAAGAAAGAWARRSAFSRAAALRRVADAIEARREALARTLTLDQGKPLHAEAYAEVDELVGYWRATPSSWYRRPRPRSPPWRSPRRSPPPTCRRGSSTS